MRVVFLDTSGLVAASARNDRNHGPAAIELAKLKAAGARFATHTGIHIELLDTLSRLDARDGAVRLLHSLSAAERAGELEVHNLSRALIDRAAHMFAARPDKEWGLTDCISFVLMHELGVYEAFTCDHHFEQAGFIRLIQPPKAIVGM